MATSIKQLSSKAFYLNFLLVQYDSYTLIKSVNTYLTMPILKKEHADKSMHLFSVKSSRSKVEYAVRVGVENNMQLPNSCTCAAYTSAALCKHIGAVLLKLSEYPMHKIRTSTIKLATHKVSTPFYIPKPVPISDSLSFYVKAVVPDDLEGFDFMEMSAKIIQAKVRFSSKVGDGIVKIEIGNNHLMLTCSCGSEAIRFCEHISVVFYELQGLDDNCFDNSKERKNKNEELAKEYGFNSYQEMLPWYQIKSTKYSDEVKARYDDVIKPLSKNNQVEDVLKHFLPATYGEISASALKVKKQEMTHVSILSNDYLYAYCITPVRATYTKQGAIKSITPLEHFASSELNDAFKQYNQLRLDYRRGGSAEQFYTDLINYSHKLQEFPILLMDDFGFKKSDALSISISKKRFSIVIDKQKNPDNTLIIIYKLKVGDDILDIDNHSFENKTAFIIYNDEMVFPRSLADYELLKQKKDHSCTVVPPNYVEKFENEILPQLSTKISVLQSNFVNEKMENSKLKRKIYLRELDNFILFSPIITYDKIDVNVLTSQELIWINYKKKIALQRDDDFENEFKDICMSLHPNFNKQNYGEVFYLTLDEMLEKGWFFEFVKKLGAHQIELLGQKELKNLKYNLNTPSFQVSIKSNIDWFDTQIELSYGDQVVSLKELRKSVVNNNDYVVLGDGSYGLIPVEWIEKLKKYFRWGSVVNNELKISKLKFNALDEEELDLEEYKDIIEEINTKKLALKNFSSIQKVPIPKKLNAELRNYQKEGLNWLGFLDEYKFGGILADDMGLGKTIQVISYLAHKFEKTKKLLALIVAPRSLIYNWKNEVEKFYPNFSVYIYHSTDRDLSKEVLEENQLIITTYGTLLNDIPIIKKVKFDWLILDESQAIKNLLSKRNKAVQQVVASRRLALTGTPIENNTLDLFAQMHVLNPYLLGLASDFKNNYAKPIDAEGNEAISKELLKMINPFIIRRTKAQVATDLPEKTETVLTCDMLPEQRSMYDALKNQVRNELMGVIDEKGLENAQIHVLSAMLKLRQICLSTALPQLDGDYGNSSAKLELLVNQLKELPKGSKALVFSQFVKMLQLTKQAFIENDITYAYLDGGSRKREEIINSFQDDDDCKVFLISLKAGGTGLNLTAADYVFILDPWWNPAAEAQAIDRAYRIGQEKHVFAYKLICKNSIEEKIMKLQERKLQVAQNIIQSEDKVYKSLNRSDIEALFD